MRPRVEGYGRPRKARWRRAGDQARAALLLSALAALPACDRLAEADPRPAFANVFGAHLEGREPPPGLDRPWPKLSGVPARPTPPDPATRERISAGLAEDRARSRAPLVVPAGLPRPPAASGPPPPPRLAGAPPVRLDPLPPAPQAAPAALPVPAQPGTPQPGAPQPGASQPVPARSAPAALPPPPPTRDLFAPPPAPSPDLLAPRRD